MALKTADKDWLREVKTSAWEPLRDALAACGFIAVVSPEKNSVDEFAGFLLLTMACWLLRIVARGNDGAGG